jgi:TonB-linked SusC/RagA family outer membrane protein
MQICIAAAKKTVFNATVLKKYFFSIVVSFLFLRASAQNPIVVKGTVTDDKNVPLSGASITLKGSKSGTATDNSGNYSFTINKSGTLVFSFAGYVNKEIAVTSSQTLSVALTQQTGTLNEVIVTGYSSQSKRDVTGAASTVSADAIAKTPVADITTALQGRVAGVNVDDQGGPGNSGVIRIRGIGSLGNNDPLYVIDGVQVRVGGATGSQNIANLLNPNDIENVTILKDPSLTALYGSEGSNGVIVITTKSGKRGEPQLEYSSYLGVETPRKFPTMVTPQQEADALYQSYTNSGQTFPYGSFYGTGTKPVLPDYIIEGPTPNLGVPAGDPRADPSLYNFNNYRILQSNKSGTNWWDAVFSPAFIQNHQLSISGATDKNNYAVTFGYLDDNGTLLNSYFKRLSLRVNTDFKPRPWLRLGENFEFSYTTNNTISTSNLDNNQNNFNNDITNIYGISPLLPTYDIAGHTAGTNGVSAILGGSSPLTSRVASENAKNYTESAIGSAYLEVDPFKNFSFQTKIGAQFVPSQYHRFADSFPQEPIPSHTTYYYEGSSYYTDWRWTNKLAYNITLNSIHKISAFVAYEAREYTSRYNSIVMTNLISSQENFQYVSDGILDPNFPPSGAGSVQTGVSEFGNVTYSLMDKYLLSGTLRHDGSSVFGTHNKYGTFPAVSAGWRISKEDFMNNINWLNDLKIRGSWGKAGNDAIPPGQQFGLIRANDAIFGGYDIAGTNISQILGAYASQIGNPDIKWETNITTNIGFDASLLNNRLSASFNWFDRQTKNLLYQPPYTGTAGAASAPYKNIMNFTNKGVELELGFKSKGTNKLTYDMNFNISSYRSNVDYINGDSTDHIDLAVFAPTHYNLTRSQVGHPVSSFYGYIQTGIFQSGDDYTKYGVTQPGLTADNAAGHFKFKDISGPNGKPDGVIDQYDQTFLGNPNPKFSFGYNLNLYYKNFDLGIFLQGVVGNKIFNYWRAYSQWPGYRDARSLDTWSPTNTDAKLPIYTQDAINSNYDAVPSSFFVEDGSYLRLKTVQVGYTFTRTRAFKSLRVYVQAFNLLTFTGYSGLDPEVNNGNPGTLGIDFGTAYPNSEKILFGVNLGL